MFAALGWALYTRDTRAQVTEAQTAPEAAGLRLR